MWNGAELIAKCFKELPTIGWVANLTTTPTLQRSLLLLLIIIITDIFAKCHTAVASEALAVGGVLLKRQVLRLVLKDERKVDSVNEWGREFQTEGCYYYYYYYCCYYDYTTTTTNLIRTPTLQRSLLLLLLIVIIITDIFVKYHTAAASEGLAVGSVLL